VLQVKTVDDATRRQSLQYGKTNSIALAS